MGLYVPSVWLACSIIDDLHRLAEVRPVRPRQRGLRAALGAARRLEPAPPVRAPAAAGHLDLRRLHAAHDPALGTDQVSLERVDNGTIVPLLTINQELVAGDLLLLRVQGQVLEAWLNRSSWSRIGVVADATYGAAGYVGVGLRGTTGRADDFGARTMGASPPPDTTPPSAPGTLAATPASATQIDLSWGAATDDSGTVAQYLIERCSGSPCTFAQVATVGGATTSYSNTGLSPSTAYSYRVRAQDAVPNVRPYSNTATCDDPGARGVAPSAPVVRCSPAATATSALPGGGLVAGRRPNGVAVTLYGVAGGARARGRARTSGRSCVVAARGPAWAGLGGVSSRRPVTPTAAALGNAVPGLRVRPLLEQRECDDPGGRRDTEAAGASRRADRRGVSGAGRQLGFCVGCRPSSRRSLRSGTRCCGA